MADSETKLSDDTSGNGGEALSKLHKMSTTAGLGSGDYVAVNIVAVIAALLGVASILAKLDNALLVVPIAGIFCGVIAIVQIGRSNGTQTGRWLAIVGLLLSLGFAGFVVFQKVSDNYRTQQDQQAIADLTREFGEKLKVRDYTGAYDLFGGDFRDRVPFEKFKSRLSFFETAQAIELYGELSSVEWNGLVQFEFDNRTGSLIAGGLAKMKFAKKGEPLRQNALFRKVGQKWKIDTMPDLFPAEKGAANGGPAGPAGPPGP